MQNTHRRQQKEHKNYATHISHTTHITPNTHKTDSTHSLTECTMPNTQHIHKDISPNTQCLTQQAKHTDHRTHRVEYTQHKHNSQNHTSHDTHKHPAQKVSQLITHTTLPNP